MISVIIHWDHKKVLDPGNIRFFFQLWDYVCRSYGVPVQRTVFVDCIGSLGSLHPPNPIVFSLQDALRLAESLEHVPVYVHDSANVDLPNFEHPEKACYIFGPNYNKLCIPEGAVSVRVPLFAEPFNLFSQAVLPIILYDRFRR